MNEIHKNTHEACPEKLRTLGVEIMRGMISRASQRLMDARDSAEVLEARHIAEAALHYAKVCGAANETHADCIRIITRAEIRMANEVDAGQAAGQLAPAHRQEKGSEVPTLSDYHLESTVRPDEGTMSMNPIRISLLAIGLVLLATAATAATYKCDAVDNLARLGYDGGQNVSIVGKDKVCKFSIAGASADGMSPQYDFDRAQMDRLMLTQNPRGFIAERLKPVVLEAAAAFGETADFVSDLTTDSDLSNLSCPSNGNVSVGRLQIRCVTITAISPDTGQNGIIIAVLFRPTFVFEILDTQTTATALVIFIPYMTQ